MNLYPRLLFQSLTGLLGVEGHKFGARLDVAALAGEGASTDIVDPSLDFKTWTAMSNR